MPRIFISYRREDTVAYAGRLYDRLGNHFGEDNFFMDIDTIDPGLDFAEAIEEAVGSCVVLIALIGPRWLASTDDTGRNRLENPEDFVRVEIAAALAREIRVIPVLVGGASMPRSTELPDVLTKLARRTALEISDTRFHHDAGRLIEALERVPDVISARPDPETSQEFTNTLGMEFVLIPAGSFIMGSPPTDGEASGDEKPAHRVRITQPFYLGKHPVTQGHWAAVMGENPSKFTGNANRPVERVSWNDVQRFMEKLNKREGVATYRLPTEAEWEYACRAGTEGPRYHTDVDVIAWYNGNNNRTTHAVGQKLPNAWGLYDMLGNVWEWCHDGVRRYTDTAADDPEGSTVARADRVVRGGHWAVSAQVVRAAYRYWDAPSYRYPHFGFRCLSSGVSQAATEAR